MLIGELHSANQKLAEQITRHHPQLITIDMDSINFIDCQIGVSLKKSFAVAAASVYPHAETEEDEVIAYINSKVLIVRQLGMPELVYVSFTSEKD